LLGAVLMESQSWRQEIDLLRQEVTEFRGMISRGAKVNISLEWNQ
jgi:hypothetical protein